MNPIVVLGLGTAGAAAAAFCARAGLPIIGIDAHPLNATGATWVNGVPAWAFDQVGIERPSGAELRAPSAPFHLIAGWDGPRMTTDSVLEVDMRLFTARLLDAARGAGAQLHGERRVRGVEGGTVHTDDGPIQASWIIDATGHAGMNLLGGPPVPPDDLCVAAQSVYAIADESGAAAWLHRHGAQQGEVVCFTGIAGGYSIVNVRIHGPAVGILTGSIPASGHAAGTKLLKQFVAEQPWIGVRQFGGSRSIPLRRPLEVVGWGRVAALGDAASMVFAAHGSGVAQQLLAAQLLAQVFKRRGDPWAFNVAWQRAQGGLLANADLLRRATGDLPAQRLPEMIRRGVLSPGLSADTMAQRPARPPVSALLRAVRGLSRMPDVARGLGPVLLRQPWIDAHYRRYPELPSGLPRWRSRLERLTGLPTWAPGLPDTTCP
jgi:menaquinone-9 beta-reductase